MQRIKITPNLTSTSVTYLNDNGVTGISYVKNPYTSTGCSGSNVCNDYTAVTKCLIDIYQGIRACQTIYLVDKNNNLLDLDRLDWIDLTIMNEFGCSVYWFSTREMEYYNGIEVLQEKVDGDIFSIDASNWDNFAKNNVFDYTKDLVYADKENGFIEIGNEYEVGEIITNPITYNEKLYITISPYLLGGDTIVVKANGSPNPVKLGEQTELISVTGDGSSMMLDIISENTNHEPVEMQVREIKISTISGVKNKGAIRVCFEDYETMHMMPANLTGVLTFKFKDNDDEESGSTHVVSCIGIGRVYKNVNLDDNLETPIISHEVIPEHITYDNTKSGLQSTTMIKAIAEACYNIENVKQDKNYEHFFGECKYSEKKDLYYWDVYHMLGIMEVDVSLEDINGNDIEGDVEYISINHLKVWFTECVKGYIYIN